MSRNNYDKFRKIVTETGLNADLALRDERVQRVAEYIINGSMAKIVDMTDYIEVAAQIHDEYWLEPEEVTRIFDLAEEEALTNAQA